MPQPTHRVSASVLDVVSACCSSRRLPRFECSMPSFFYFPWPVYEPTMTYPPSTSSTDRVNPIPGQAEQPWIEFSALLPDPASAVRAVDGALPPLPFLFVLIHHYRSPRDCRTVLARPQPVASQRPLSYIPSTRSPPRSFAPDPASQYDHVFSHAEPYAKKHFS